MLDLERAFDWVDDYLSHVRDQFEVRREDRLLIVLPNKAVKLNGSGVAILGFLKRGGAVADLLARVGDDRQRRLELHYFLCDFRRLISGCLHEGGSPKAVDIEPFTGSINTLPVLSEVALTYRCNLRCRFCYAACGCHGQSGAGARPLREMSTRQVRRVLKIIRRDAKVPSVSFTGGEPLLRDDLEELVAAATRLGLRCNLITNGTLATPERAAALAKAGLKSAQVSLEGPTGAIHDVLTGVRGSFELTLAGLEALRQAGLHVHTNTTINALNTEHLPAMADLLGDLGIRRMSANLVIPSGSAADLSLQVSYSRIGPVVLSLREAARRRGIEFMWYSPTPMCLFNPLAQLLGNKSCAACDGLLSVSPTGDVLPCSSFAHGVGNLLRDGFAGVWQSARARFYRDKKYAPEACSQCADLAACAGACPLYWEAMGTGELALAGRAEHVPA